MSDSPTPEVNDSPKTRPYLISLLLLGGLILGFSGWANLSWDVTDSEDFKYFPPFKAGFDRNGNRHLGAEYFSIARAIADGRGFSDPFGADTGPTAWMPPVLCWIEAGLLTYYDHDLDSVMNAIILLQILALFLAVWVVLIYCGQSPRWWVSLVIITQLMLHFKYAFQNTHDCGLLMLVVDGLLAGLAWGRVFSSNARAILWGGYGGLAVLCSPVVGFCWVALSFLFARGHYRRFALALVTMALVLTPWTIRNYQVFGKFIPVKSNLFYELYQSQCLQETGVLQATTFGSHPWGKNNKASRDYRRKGEMEFLQEKKELFLEALEKDPMDFVERVGERFLAVTLIYEPHEPQREKEFPEALTATCLTYPLPFLGWLWLLVAYLRFGLTRVEKIVFWIYPLYFLPYIVVSYYNRYEFPLLTVKWILIIWFGDRVVRTIRRCFRRGTRSKDSSHA